jgi:uncharacterized membrane protein
MARGFFVTFPRMFDRLLDGLLLIALFMFLFAGHPFLSPQILIAFQEYPILHRLMINLPLLLLVAILVLKKGLFPKMGFQETLLGKGLETLGEVHPLALVLGISGLYVGIMSTVSISRVYALQAGFDLGIFTQAIYNTTRGDFFFSSIKGGICLLGDHMSPILGFFALPYALWPDVRLLIVLQALIPALCIPVIYQIAMHRLKDQRLSLIFAIAYALYLPTRNAVRFDFHPELIADLMILLSLLFFLKGKRLVAVLFILATLLCKENMAGVVGIFGVYLLLFGHERSMGALLMVVAVVAFIGTVQFAIPAIGGQPYSYAGNFFGGLSGMLGGLVSLGTLEYFVKIFLPVGLLSFLSPSTLLLCSPILGQNLLSNNPYMHDIFFQYTTGLTPFVFFSAIIGLSNLLHAKRGWKAGLVKRLGRDKASSKRRLAAVILVCAVAMSGVSEWHVWGHYRYQRPTGIAALHEVLKEIPEEASVRAAQAIVPLVANRRWVHVFENDHPREGGSSRAMRSDYVVLNLRVLGAGTQNVLADLVERGYRTHWSEGGFAIFKAAWVP